MFKHHITRLLIGIIALAATAGTARACVCLDYVNPRWSVGLPSIIFSGKVVGVQHVAPDGRPESLVATIDVVERWKGAVPDRVTVEKITSGPTCGFANTLPVGETVMLFTDPLPLANPRRPDLAIYLCSASGLLRERTTLVTMLSEFRAENESLNAALELARSLNPISMLPPLLLERAKFLESWGDPTAIELYRVLTQWNPPVLPAYHGLLRVLITYRKLDEAVGLLARTEDLAPTDPETVRLSGLLASMLHTR